MDKSHHALVSIVLCTYNGEQFLKQQLDSLINQTYPYLEIIIVDDKSTDDTKEILESYAAEHPFIKLFFNESNLGYNKNFEKAISLSSGDYISICDQDDIWYNKKIKTLVNAIGNNWAVFSNSEFIDTYAKPLNIKLIRNPIIPRSYESILMENFFTGHTSLLSRNCLEYILPIPQNGYYDWWIGFVCLYHNKLAYHNEILTQYRIHQYSVIQLKNQGKTRDTLKNIDIQLETFLAYKNLKPSDKQAITGIKEKIKGRTLFNPLWFKLLINYPRFFPKRTYQGFVSRLNFLRKFLNRESSAAMLPLILINIL